MQNVYTRKNRGSSSINNGSPPSSSSYIMTTTAKTEATAMTAPSASTTSSIANPFQTSHPRQRRRRRRKNKGGNNHTDALVLLLITIVSIVTLAFVFIFNSGSANSNSSSSSNIVDDDFERIGHANGIDLRGDEFGEKVPATRLGGAMRNNVNSRKDKNKKISDIVDDFNDIIRGSKSADSNTNSNRLLDKSKSFLKNQKQKIMELGSNMNVNMKMARGQKKKKKGYTMPLSSFEDVIDPNLKTMTFQFPSYGEDDHVISSEEIEFQAYVQPHISKFYNSNESDKGNDDKEIQMKTVKKPHFKGQAGKFINLSKQHLVLNWLGGGQMVYIADTAPFQAVGTSTFPGHIFTFSTKEKSSPSKNKIHASSKESEVHRIHVVGQRNVYYYDPYYNSTTQKINLENLHNDLNTEELEQYWLQRRNIDFGNIYHNFTGREWLSLYPKRKPPHHLMWNADYFGQEHWVVSEEAHFVREPPENLLGMLSYDDMVHGSAMHQKRHLKDYRQTDGFSSNSHAQADAHDRLFLNMTLKVLSCAPRVFEIKNFLSQVEVDHIVHMATGMKLSLSTTSGSDGFDRRSDTKTRTSKNSWVGRSRSPIIDSIYRRAADLMLIDEALLRRRDESERHEHGDDVRYNGGNSAEDLQLVHYSKSEKYTAHHDFAYPSAHKEHQPARFATLLLYLNEGMDGGQTSFPRWVNAETSDKLSVVPEVGKAILFYSFLPDGNMDDLSQHAAEPVVDGEKWLINLWTWDPSR